jgi:hypothetical protein
VEDFSRLGNSQAGDLPQLDNLPIPHTQDGRPCDGFVGDPEIGPPAAQFNPLTAG